MVGIELPEPHVELIGSVLVSTSESAASKIGIRWGVQLEFQSAVVGPKKLVWLGVAAVCILRQTSSGAVITGLHAVGMIWMFACYLAAKHPLHFNDRPPAT